MDVHHVAARYSSLPPPIIVKHSEKLSILHEGGSFVGAVVYKVWQATAIESTKIGEDG
jgi:hypothetical protein